MTELAFFINKVLISGAVIGSIYALGAIGVTLVFSILRFAHFAHGDMMTLGAFLALMTAYALVGLGVETALPIAFVAMPFAMIMTALLAIGIDRTFYQPLRRANLRPVVFVMASVGVMLMIQGLIRLFWGTSTRTMYIADRKEIYRVSLPFDERANLIITEPQILLILFTAIAVITLHYFLTQTRLGKAMRAMSDNAELARVTGINTQHVVMATWIIGGGLAASAGTMLALDVTLKPDLAFNILLPIFAAAIVGGIGQPYGAIAGGFVVGFSETLAVFNWAVLLRPFRDVLPEWYAIPAQMSLVPTEYKITVPFFILVVVLIWRPTGIFKGRVLT